MSLLKRNTHERRGGGASGEYAANGSPLQCRGGSAHSSAGLSAGTPNSRAAKLQSLLAQTQGVEGSPAGTNGCSALGSFKEGFTAASQYNLAGRPTSAIVGMRNAGFTGLRTASSTADATKTNASCVWLGSVSSTASGKNAGAPSCAICGGATIANAAAGAEKGATGANLCDALTDRGGVPVVLRSTAEKLANPERLNLDRRSLEACPVLEGEERLRLLNFQNNSITSISNLHSLPHLIFLDMYSNQIKEIAGLDAVPTLRVLMLGKNQISTIENLDSLRRLDVLDLHCNSLTRVGGLSNLCALRVLNLAANQIDRLEPTSLKGLTSLMELNLRRNKLCSLVGLGAAPFMQRLFLSSNRLATHGAISQLATASNLIELALDGNPVASEAGYRQAVVEVCPSLRQLDMRRLSDEERKLSAAQSKKESERAAAVSKASQATDERDAAIRTARMSWQAKQARGGGGGGGGGGGVLRSALRRARGALDGCAAYERVGSSHFAVLCLTCEKSGKPSEDQERKDAADGAAGAAEGGRRSLVEVVNSERGRRLNVYGVPPESIQRTEHFAEVVVASIEFVSAEALASRLVPPLRSLTRLRSLMLAHNGINSLAQLHALCALPQLTELSVSASDNDVVSRAHFRSVAAMALPSLEILNGTPLTADERQTAERVWSRMHRLYSLASTSLHARFMPPHCRLAIKQQSPTSADANGAAADASGAEADAAAAAPASDEPASAFVERVLGHACLINDKISQLNVLWPEVLDRCSQSVAADERDRTHLMKRLNDTVQGLPMRD